MQLIGTRGQAVSTPMYDLSGTVGTGGTAQLIMARHVQRSYLLFQNTSSGNLLLGIGGPTATATVTNGAVSAITVVNTGFNYTYAPLVTLVGGGYFPDSSVLPDGLTYASPGGFATTNTAYTTPLVTWRPATAHCVMTGSPGALTIGSIAVDDGGLGYQGTPYVLIQNDPRDPFGCFLPSATSGLLITGNGSFVMEASCCTTDPIAVFGATTGQAYVCKVII